MMVMVVLGLMTIYTDPDAAGQSVPHFHVHLIPRYSSDDALQLEFHESAPQDLDALKQLLSE